RRGNPSSSMFILVQFSIPLQDVDRADAAAAPHVAETVSRYLARLLALHLARAGFTAQLERGLPDLRQPRGAARMATRNEPTIGRHATAPADLEVAAFDTALRFARLTEPEQLVIFE